MPFLIYDRNGNLYTNISPTKATLYRTKAQAFEALKALPSGYTVRDADTRREVKPD